jgi:hypothetical protein
VVGVVGAAVGVTGIIVLSAPTKSTTSAMVLPGPVTTVGFRF